VEETPYNDARRIRRGERDHELALDLSKWPEYTPPLPGWERFAGHLARRIALDERGLLAVPLEEAMLRFPAAPLHGVQRLHEGHSSAGKAQNFHSYRILTKQGFVGPVDRVFLFQNGLNELDRMGLYYQLASNLINDPEHETACILRPFPGHLTRFPYYGFADTPLDRYLWDGSHLFRQFLRYMVETQWFLSALVKRSRYRCPSGAYLLAEGEKDQPNRLDDATLADAMTKAWQDMYRASEVELAKIADVQTKAPGLKDVIEDGDHFEEDISSLRSYLKLEEYPNLGSELTNDEAPTLHVLGYSLGGFLAQSIFMSWPFVVDSCSTLLSGGALRELAPTAFADPEEWQTVLHSLRYELDEGMISGRLGSEPGLLAGMDSNLFRYFQHTFYEVFQQEYRGSFQSRLSEFRQRMLFIVGGNDPIVRPRSVLDSEPPGGINLLEIGGLGHFIGERPNGPEETKQRSFWLPEIGGLVRRFAEQAAAEHRIARHDTWLDCELMVTASAEDEKSTPDDEEGALSEIERNAFRQDGALPAQLFERYLDDLLARDADGRPGFLWILRNEIPTFLLDKPTIQRRARALHHDDMSIVNYCRGVWRRREALLANREHVSVVLPWNARRILKRVDADHGLPSQAESAVGLMPDSPSLASVWATFIETCTGLVENDMSRALLVFDGRQLLAEQRNEEPVTKTPQEEHAAEMRAALVRAGLAVVRENAVSQRPDGHLRVSSLPDCWIWASHKFLGISKRSSAHDIVPRLLAAAVDARRKDSTLAHSLRDDELRIVTVSRARYNPRFRGRLVTDLESAKSLLLHSALCVSAARPFERFDWDAGEAASSGQPQFMRARAGDAAPPTAERVL